MARKPPHNAPKFSRLITAIAFTLIVSARAAGQNYTSFPHIKSLNQSDPVFLQLTELVEAYYRADGRGGPMHEVLFFQYRVKEEEDLFFIAARTNIGFAALATLNGLTHSNSLAPGDTIIIPSAPGIFIPTEARNELDKIMLLIRVYGHQAPILSKITFADGSVFHYIPGAKLNVMELAFFLGVLFRFPIPLGGTISSVFGSRLHPITGEEKFHSGIDIAAHEGTDVIAAREGTVSATGFQPACPMASGELAGSWLSGPSAAILQLRAAYPGGGYPPFPGRILRRLYVHG